MFEVKTRIGNKIISGKNNVCNWCNDLEKPTRYKVMWQPNVVVINHITKSEKEFAFVCFDCKDKLIDAIYKHIWWAKIEITQSTIKHYCKKHPKSPAIKVHKTDNRDIPLCVECASNLPDTAITKLIPQIDTAMHFS